MHQIFMYLSAEQSTRIIGVLVLLLLCPATHWHTLRASPRPDGSDSDGDYESLATFLAVVIAAFANRKTHSTRIVEEEDSRRLRHVVVGARDRRERGGRQPSPLQAHTACFPRSTNEASSACAEMLRFG